MNRVSNALMPIAPPPVSNAHAHEIDEVLKQLHVDPRVGLNAQTARRRRLLYGANLLRYRKPRSAWKVAIDQLKSLIIWLLIAAAALSFALEEWPEGLAILVVILINAAIGFTAEIKAIRSMESLRRLARVTTRVLRNGKAREIPAEALVPGDIVLLDGGDVVTADLRLIEAAKLQCDESTLSGESLPVSKSTAPIASDALLVERSNMAFKGTAVTRGTGKGVVVATGTYTELGKIAALAEEAEPAVSPLEKRLDHLSGQLLWLTLGLVILVALSGMLAGKDAVRMLQTGIALAVAAVPEGLPIVATLALARGMWRMAQKNVLIERLSAVETLGATTVIFADKTGTLTENRMTVTEISLADDSIEIEGPVFVGRQGRFAPDQNVSLMEALRLSVLCSNAELQSGAAMDNRGVGDPMEVALLVAARKAGIERRALAEQFPEVHEDAFDPATKLMATFHDLDGGYLVAVKGAPEAVLRAATSIWSANGLKLLTDQERNKWTDANRVMASKGMRVLAVARKEVRDIAADPYEGLELVGLVGFEDPPRGDVGAAIRACGRAGVRVVMVTGDQAITAQNIASAIGLADDSEPPPIDGHRLMDLIDDRGRADELLLATPIFARVTPEQKLRLIEAFQNHGHVVAMTGDGVNDAPALKKADIGIAMGKRGTQVAREAAAMVLRDDAFPSIIAAIRQGRIIFGNIRKFVLYLLSCNLSEILIVSLAAISNLPLPLLPLQILFLNLVTDVFPAFALGAGEGEGNIMHRPPRSPKESILTRRHWLGIGGYGVLITAAVMIAFAAALFWLDATRQEAVTVSFLTLALAQLWHVFNMRDSDTNILSNEVVSNPLVWGAIGICLFLLSSAIYVPVMTDLLQITRPSAMSWLLIVLASLLPLLVGQLIKFAAVSRRNGSQGPRTPVRI